MKALYSGAEAVISKDNGIIIKNRFPKNYRISEIDVSLRKSRTKREIKVMEKLKSIGINVPKVLKSEETIIGMSEIEGKQVKYLLDEDAGLATEIGRQLGIMHDNGILHGDLTTSNMIWDEKDKKLYFIDFGLSYFSKKIEDMAVDIHLFKQALESRHYRVMEKAYANFLKGYNPKMKKEIIARVMEVERRGRYKEKI